MKKISYWMHSLEGYMADVRWRRETGIPMGRSRTYTDRTVWVELLVSNEQAVLMRLKHGDQINITEADEIHGFPETL